MAVKPLVQPEIWASNALYTTGPFIGSSSKVVPGAGIAAEGHRPGANFPTPAEYENSQQNRITGLCQWVFAGSFAGAADAHPLETDAAGRTAVTGLTVDDPVDENAVVITSVATSLNFAVMVSCTTGGTAVGASIGNASANAMLAGIGSGAGSNGLLVTTDSTPNTGSGVRVNANAATAAPGVRVEHAGTGFGELVTHTGSGTGIGVNTAGSGVGISINTASGTGTALSVTGNTTTTAAAFQGGAGQAAIAAISGNNAGSAVGGVGVGTAIGVDGSGGNGSAAAVGARGTAVHADAVGVHGRTSTSASAIASGVYGEARGAGTTGVHGDGGTVGRGLIAQADASTPAYSAMRIIPQDADPTSATSDGEVIWHASHKTLRTCVAGYGYRSTIAMGPGSAMIVNATSTTVTEDAIAGGGLYSDVLTVLCDTTEGTGFYGLAAGAEVLISVSCDVRTTTTATNTINVLLQDVTDGSPIAEWNGPGTAGNNGFFLSAAVTEWQRTIVCNVRYPVPNDGDLEVLLRMGATGAQAEVRNVALTITGTF